MNVTNVKVRKFQEPNRIKGVAKITLDDSLVIHGIKIMAKRENNELYVQMPNRRDKDGTYRDYCHPITNELRNKITTAVLDELNRK